MKMQSDERGFALLSVILIGMISMTLVSMLYFVLVSHTQMSGKDKRYLTELESAKGASQYIMAALRDTSLTCNAGGNCSVNDSIDLHGSICNALGRTNACTGLTATYLSETTEIQGAGLPDITAVAVRVSSTGVNNRERAIVEFVYKLY